MSLVVERLGANHWVPPWIRHQHLTRYQWVATMARGCVVLDAACGNGYGAQMLSAAGAVAVDGFDLCVDAIREAQAIHRGANLRFAVGDVTRLDAPDHHYDLFVSLETIEHLVDDRAYLAEAVRVLRPAGKFICSTPNRAVTNPGIALCDRPFNPFHVREYTLAALDELLRGYFGKLEWYGQSNYRHGYARLLYRLGRIWPRMAVRVHQARKVLTMPWETAERHYPTRMALLNGEPEVLVAVCTGPRSTPERPLHDHAQPLARVL